MSLDQMRKIKIVAKLNIPKNEEIIFAEFQSKYGMGQETNFLYELELFPSMEIRLSDLKYCAEELSECVENFFLEKIFITLSGLDCKKIKNKNIVRVKVIFEDEFIYLLEAIESTISKYKKVKEDLVSLSEPYLNLFSVEYENEIVNLVDKLAQSSIFPLESNIDEILLLEFRKDLGWRNYSVIARFA